MDNRERNQKAAEKQQHVKAVEEKVTSTVAEVSQAPLQQQIDALTKRNREYVYRLRKALTAGGMSETEQNTKLQALLPEILMAQQKGQPANQLFGPPVAKADSIINAPKPPKVVKLWMKMVDSTLLFGVFMFALAAISLFTNKNVNPNQLRSFGIVNLIIIALIAGVGFTWLQEKISAPKAKRLPMWQLIILSALVVIGMFVLVSVSAMLPPVINPVLPAVADVIILAVLFGVRYLFRRKYGVTGGMFSTPRPTTDNRSKS
ncbi:DUF1129 domain-containing protein [Agrilactobacillus fermenti]|uniref:DUF1129 domain-containing protein n=1 Tax=Agrilactobacillus fermenti TaxID=2586909 RepID=UPI001E6296E9|nr:DUF1129 family protein [Agrilactobacillus fermenti]MCD2255498.1 DUF1129 domain-containing protein [Agrilactobacillus fermenti]